MSVPKFKESELQVKGEKASFMPGAPGIPLYNFPVAPKEALLATYKREPIWQITGVETTLFTPMIYPDNVARAFVFETDPLPRERFGGKDMFGIDWVYVDMAGGSIVKPGTPFLQDANEWKDKLVWPDIDAWDWKGSAERNKALLDTEFFIMPWILNGYFERLISFMDFEEAALALIDADQKDAVKSLFTALTELYIKIVDKFIEYYHVKGFYVHDDWGSQRSPFFSPAVAREMIVPAMRELTDYLHGKGCIAELHSCGHLELQVPNMIEAGWDAWSGMAMNNTQKLYEQYGDKILIGVVPDPLGPDAPEEDQRAAARDYVKKFANPKKPSIFNIYGAGVLTPAYREELYKQSRILFGGV